MNDRVSGDELVIHIIQRMAQGDLPSELIDAAPHHQYLDPDRHRAGAGLLQIIDGPFTATLDHLTTQPVPMDRDTQVRNYHYDTHTAVLDLYGGTLRRPYHSPVEYQNPTNTSWMRSGYETCPCRMCR